MTLDTFDNDYKDLVDPIEFFKSLAQQEKISLSKMVTHFLRDRHDNKQTPIFYDYTQRTGFTQVSDQSAEESIRLLEGLSRNDEICYETHFDDDLEITWLYLKNENSEIVSMGGDPHYYEPFVFKTSDVVKYLKIKNVPIPEYINSKLSISQPNDEEISNQDNEENMIADNHTVDELKNEIKKQGERYIELTKLLLRKMQIKNEQDLLEKAIEYRNLFWDNYLDNKIRSKKDAIVLEIKSLKISINKAKAIELISVPINRNPKK